MAAENARVDTTFIGYFLIGFILLMFGVLGLQWGWVFGDYTAAGAYKNMPIDDYVFKDILVVAGALLILFTVFAYRTGKQVSAAIFAMTGLFLIAMKYQYYGYNSDWFLSVAFAIFFLIIAIYAFTAKAPKFVALLLLLIALMAFFIALAWAFGSTGPGNNIDTSNAMCVIFGIFALLGFVIATYLGLAYANPKKVPLI